LEETIHFYILGSLCTTLLYRFCCCRTQNGVTVNRFDRWGNNMGVVVDHLKKMNERFHKNGALEFGYATPYDSSCRLLCVYAKQPRHEGNHLG
jgi:hypothetical protein